MDIVSFRNYCIKKKGVTESFPFDSQTLVFKVMDKMFALTSIEVFENINLKCDPEKAIELREHYDAILPGYHMNKKHWNTVKINGTIPDQMLCELIDHSYDLVVSGLPKAKQQLLST